MAPTANFVDLCRICATETQSIVRHFIFEGEGKLRDLSKKIAACLPVKVKEDDRLPKVLCGECVYKLDLLHEFREKSQKTEAYLFTLIDGPADDHHVKKQSSSQLDDEDEDDDDSRGGDDGGHHDMDDDDDMERPVPPPPVRRNAQGQVCEPEVVIKIEEDTSQSKGDAAASTAASGSATQAETVQDNDEGGPSSSKRPRRAAANKRPIREDSPSLEAPSSPPPPKRRGRKPKGVTAAAATPGTSTSGDIENRHGDTSPELLMEVEEVEDEDDHNKPEVEVIDVLSSDDDSNSCEGIHPNDLLLVQLSEGEDEAHSEYNRTFRWPNYVKPLDLTTQSSNKDKKEKWLASDEFKKLLHNCEICGVHFEDHKNLLEHIVIHSRKNKKSEESIKLNILKRKSPMVIKHYFMCDICQKKFRGKKDLEYHIAKHHLEFEICIYCRKGFPTAKEMVDHRLICRSKILKYSCNKCRAKFRSKAKLRIHVVEERCSQYTCSICELVFGNVQSLISHENRHTGKVVKGFKCKVCNKSFLYDYSLAAHMKCHEEIDELPAFYHCDVCKKNYKRKDSFMRHLEAHNPAARKHHCTECELSFIQLSGLRQHIAVSHNKEKRFECEICHMRFGTSTIRNNHIRSVHLNIKEVMCTVCGKMFKKKTHLKNHMLIHTGETPYPCKACDKRFQTRGNLFAHEIRVHNILPWKCAQCGECFKQKVLLATHKSEQHRK